MRITKLLFSVLLFSSLAAGQSTTTITGTIKNLGTGNVSQGTFVRFYLRGCAGNLPRINGTAIIAPTLGNVYYFDFPANSSGQISGSLYSTRDATGNGNGAIECGGSLTAVWYGMVPFLNGKAGPEVPIAAKASATIDISNVTPLSTSPVVTAPTGDSTYARLDGGNTPFTGAISAKAVNTAQSVMGYLCKGDGSTDDSTCVTNAITAACAAANANGSNAAEVDFPLPSVSYKIASTLTLSCAGLRLHGIGGQPQILFTGSGCLFTQSGQRNIEIDHLDLEGSAGASTWAICHTSNVASALSVSIHDNIINNFGSIAAGGSGGCISIASDSQRLSIKDNKPISCNNFGIQLTAPADGLEISNNTFTSTTGNPNGPTRCIDSSGATGSATMRIEHNIFECEGSGALRVTGAGSYIVNFNESETLHAVTDANSDIFEFDAGVQAIGNTSNSHSNANYDFFVTNNPVTSVFAFNLGSNYVTNAFHVGTGAGNLYDSNNGSAGPGTVYSATYAGIRSVQNGAQAEQIFGCSNSTFNGTVFCGFPIFFSVSGTASNTPFQILEPSLANGNAIGFVVGDAFSTNNGAGCQFNNVGGAASASNTMQCGLINGGLMTISSAGAISTPSTYTSSVATGTAPLSITSTTPVSNLAATPTTYNAAGTQQTNAHIVEDTCTLGTNCGVTLTGSAAFTSSSSYSCACTDQTAAAACKGAQTSGSAVTFTGTGADVLRFVCVGN